MRLDHLLSREQGEAERRSLQTEVDLPERAERTGRRDGRTGETLLERQVVRKTDPVSFSGSPNKRDPEEEPRGGLAQLGERLLCKQEVIGSIPIISTTWVASSAG